MKRSVRSNIVLAVVASLACTAGFAQSSGEALYKEKCLNCHGADGMASSGVGQAMKVMPVSNPQVKKMTEEEMYAKVRDGMGKMQAYKGDFTDAQIKSSVGYFRRFLK